MRKLLSVSVDAKTIKSIGKGVLTGILYLAPGRLSGREVCPMASAGCLKSCLYSAGRGAFSNVQKARISKTNLYFDDRELFFNILYRDIVALERKAKRDGLIPAVRLNGTSDIPFERVAFIRDGVEYDNIMQAFPAVTFYDYTKRHNRNVTGIKNYSLTFSLSEINLLDAIRWIAGGKGNVAIVYRDQIPALYWLSILKPWPVIDGTGHDARFLDQRGVIVGLCAKGAAKRDTSGFVI